MNIKKEENKFLIPFILVTSLFFLWALAHNLNPILIPHLKKACNLTDLESALIDSSFFIAYFLMALPAGMFLKKYGYKNGIILGLLLFATGAFLFYPAASVLSFPFFLTALFVIASGLTFLETAANPYITVLGNPKTATQRLNLAQSFNGLGAFIAPLIGGLFILSGRHLTEYDLQTMTAEQVQAFNIAEAASVKMPYIFIGALVLLVAIVFSFINLPEIIDINRESSSVKSVLKHNHLRAGIAAQFFYVGAQVGVGSFFIRFLNSAASIDEKSAAYYLSVALLLFMAGRFIGTLLMQFIRPQKLLTAYSVINVILLLPAIFFTGMISVYTLMAVQFFMSIMFPTIFSLSIANTGSDAKLGSSLIIMSIVGGAIIPVIMGYVSDATQSIQTAYVVPLLCFLVVAYYGAAGSRINQIQNQ
ncbi:MAG TPA: L-fucose:H+ symporter permease [Bacteroidia bacterium]|nr:L-fucose:H+ symporter permease [Bacteroidia bacterium]HNU34895.1 L-fucose:H+ symporter permease [Bacteroidia bacterium]